MRAHETGVEIVDRTLGGLLPGLPCVIAGASGTGRTVLSLQMAAHAVDSGRVVTYVCNEPAPFLVQQAKGLGLRVSSSLRSGRLALLELDAGVSAMLTGHGMEPFADAVKREQPLASLLVVDPFSVLMSGFYEEARLREAARFFVETFKDVAMVFTVESERLALQAGLERVLSEVSGAFVRLDRDENGARKFVVEKRRSGPGEIDRARFTIAAGKGVVIEEPEVPRQAAPRSQPSPEPVPAAPARDRPGPDPSTDAAPDTARRDAPREPEPVEKREADGQRSVDMTRAIPLASSAAVLAEKPEDPLILIVDSNRSDLALMTKALGDRYRVITARDGFEAMSLFLTQQPSLVILELVMKRVTGFELLSALQRAGSHVPRLVVSERVRSPAHRLSPLILGATDLMAKPIERFELLRKVETLLRLSGPPPELVDPSEAEALFATFSNSRILDATDFRDRLGRACAFGERYGYRSSMLAVSGRSTKAVDALLQVAEENLRLEDAMLRVSKRRIVVLLIATEIDVAPTVVERLAVLYAEAGEDPDLIEWRVRMATPIGEQHDWRPLFQDADSAEDDGGEGDES